VQAGQGTPGLVPVCLMSSSTDGLALLRKALHSGGGSCRGSDKLSSAGEGAMMAGSEPLKTCD